MIIIERISTINVLCLNHSETIPHPALPVGKNLPQNWSLVSKKLRDHCIRQNLNSVFFFQKTGKNIL